jgi:hypothetical protein
MADRYWVGGSATWDATAGTKWAATSGGAGGETAPTTGDNVFFDAASGAVSVALGGVGLGLLNLNTVGFTGTFTGSGTRTIGGSVTLGGGATYSNTGTFTLNSTSPGNTITSNGAVLDNNWTFNGAGGEWSIQDKFTTGATRVITLTAGTLNLNNQILECGSFSSNNTNVRTIAFGTGKFVLKRNSTTIWTTSDNTNLTITGTAVVDCTYSGASGSRTINGGVTNFVTANLIDFNVTAGTDTLVFSSASTGANFGNVNLTGFAGPISSGGSIVRFHKSLTLDVNCTPNFASGSTVEFVGPGGTITSASTEIGTDVVFDGVNATWTMSNAFNINSAKTLTFKNGTIKLKNGVTSSVGTFATSGTTQKFLQSSLAGSQATLSQASGTVNATYLTIKDINAIGGATWNARTDLGAKDISNNTGWNFIFIGVKQILNTIMKKILRPIIVN